MDDKGNIVRKRKLEYLNLRVSKDYTAVDKSSGKPKHRRIEAQDKETWILARKICRKRELMLLHSDQELITADKRQDENFVEFFIEQMKGSAQKDNASYRGALFNLRQFTQGTLTFRNLDSI